MTYRPPESYHHHQQLKTSWTMWHSRPTTVQNPPSILKDGRKHHIVDYHHYSHAPPYKPDRAFNTVSNLIQTGSVQKYLNNIDRLNVFAEMTNHHLVNIIWNGITPRLRQAIAHYEDLRSDPSKCKKKLLQMDFITTKFHKKEQDNRSKGQGKNCSLDDRIQLRGGETGSEKKKGEFVPKDVWDKRKEEERCMK